MRILLSSKNLRPTPWIEILEDKDLEKRFFGRLNLDLLDKIIVA
jgi:ribosomal protein S1